MGDWGQEIVLDPGELALSTHLDCNQRLFALCFGPGLEL